MDTLRNFVVLAIDWTPVLVALIGLVLPIASFLGSWGYLTYRLWRRAIDAEELVKLYRDAVGPIKLQAQLLRPVVFDNGDLQEEEAWPYIRTPRTSNPRRKRSSLPRTLAE